MIDERIKVKFGVCLRKFIAEYDHRLPYLNWATIEREFPFVRFRVLGSQLRGNFLRAPGQIRWVGSTSKILASWAVGRKA